MGIKAQFTICSVTRYTGGVNERILSGGRKNWLHGHHMSLAGVAYYEGWKTAESSSIPVTNWVVMCGTNAGSQLKLANGVDVGTGTGGGGDVSLYVNAGEFSLSETSNFAIAEVVVWDRGLTDEEMHEASAYLMDKFIGVPPLLSSLAWYQGGTFDIAAGTWPDASGRGNDATLSGSGLTGLNEVGHGARASRVVVSLAGTTSSAISFGNVIKAQFTICSVTRYTGGVNGRILNGGGKNWLHGHHSGLAGVAYYDGWKTAESSSIPVTNWVVMCGTNAGSQLKLANGVDVGTGTGGGGDVSLYVNAGDFSQ